MYTHLAVEEPEEANGAQRLYDTRIQDQLVVTAQVELYTVHADTLHRQRLQGRHTHQRHLAQVVGGDVDVVEGDDVVVRLCVKQP